MKSKEREKRDKYLHIAKKNLRNLWNMKQTVISALIRELGRVSEDLENELEELVFGGRIENIPAIA